MENKATKCRLGYIDEESQWVEKFTLRLKDAFEIFILPLKPETTLDDMIAQVEEAKLDCLIADFELKEADVIQFNGDEVIDALRKKYPYFPVFIITAKEEDDVLSQVEDNEIVRLKEELDKRPTILIQRIQNKIDNYHNAIRDAEKVVEQLIEKKNTGGLTGAEEETLTEKYQFFDKISPDEKILPENLIQPQAITQLHEFAADTKKILEELRKITQ